MMSSFRSVSVLWVLLFLSLDLGAQVEASFPDTFMARSARIDVLSRPVQRQSASGPEIIPQGELNPRVQFQVYYQGESTPQGRRNVYYFSWVPEKNFRFDPGTKGHSVVKMDAVTGKVESLKIFFQDTRLETTEDLGRKTWGSFLLITPQEPRTLLSVYVEGQRIAAELPLPWSLAQAVAQPLSKIKAAVAEFVDWEMIQPERTWSSQRVGVLAALIREGIRGAAEATDGGQDENGRWIYLADGTPQGANPGFNCSGFAKWVVDGLVRDHNQGLGLQVSSEPGTYDLLKKKHWDLRGNSFTRHYDQFYDEFYRGRKAPAEALGRSALNRDPFFGLDWTRNLAVAAQALRQGRTQAQAQELRADSQDVRKNSFFSYTASRGFPIANLDPIFYELAVKNPGQIYLGSVSGDYTPPPGFIPEGTPGAAAASKPMNQHHHVAVFLPWIDSFGDYRLAVFENGRETSLTRLQGTWKTNYVHLVSLDGTGEFRPFPGASGQSPGPRPNPGRLFR